MAMRRFIRAVISNAVVTSADSAAPVSARLDPLLLAAAGLLPFEEVEIVSVTTGERLVTFVEPGAKGEVRVHSGVTHHVRIGEVVSILSYGLLHDGQTLNHSARVVTLADGNEVVAVYEKQS
jgi:aspartate 1-decarboxylase